MSGQQRDEILPVTGKAIPCNGSCFTVAAFQREVQYLNMWYPVPNQNSLCSRCKELRCADNLYLWLSELTPSQVLFLMFPCKESWKKGSNISTGCVAWKVQTQLNFLLYWGVFSTGPGEVTIFISLDGNIHKQGRKTPLTGAPLAPPI